MNRTNARKLILSNVLVAFALFVFLIWIGASGQDVTVYGATKPIPFTYDIGVFNITDLSLKEGAYSSDDLIGFIQNVDSYRTIKGVSLKIEMYDRNNHLIDVAESGYSSSLPETFAPQTKSAFKIPIDKNNELDHLNIQILATDWGPSTSYIPPVPTENVSAVGNYSSDRPYIGLAGLDLTPDISKQIGLNQTKGLLITNITEGSPAEKADLRGGTTTKYYNDREINVGGDIILKIDNREVSFMHDITAYIQSQKNIGDNVTLTILRDNATENVDVTLGKMPSQVFAEGNDSLQNPYFSIKVPDNWTYIEGPGTQNGATRGYGPSNTIHITPTEFSDLLLSSPSEPEKFVEKIVDGGGAFATLYQDVSYRIKNAPLESYMKYIINQMGIQNITSQRDTTVGNEKSVSAYGTINGIGNPNFGGMKFAIYVVMHDNLPYALIYSADEENYEKYLPDFEQMVKSFSFVDIPSEIQNLSQNENSQELYDECVSQAGKEFCDFLFKK